MRLGHGFEGKRRVTQGGRVAGFVYFEHLPAHVGRFELHAGFAAAGGERVIRLEIPFVVS